MRRLDARAASLGSRLPGLVIHGERDAHVPFDVAREVAARHPRAELLAVEGSTHGFAAPEHEEVAVAATVDWLARAAAATTT